MRATSPMLPAASASFRIPIICSSVNLDFRIQSSLPLQRLQWTVRLTPDQFLWLPAQALMQSGSRAARSAEVNGD